MRFVFLCPVIGGILGIFVRLVFRLCRRIIRILLGLQVCPSLVLAICPDSAEIASYSDSSLSTGDKSCIGSPCSLSSITRRVGH